MTNRRTVSETFNNWYDGQRVDQIDMDVEQDRNVNTDASIISNHFGSGVLPNSSSPAVIFDSDSLTSDQVALVASNDFDGTGLSPHGQPTDTNLGNQLQVQLLDSEAVLNGPAMALGRLSTKVLILGVDFEGNIQSDAL
jgi:hypothetical protein